LRLETRDLGLGARRGEPQRHALSQADDWPLTAHRSPLVLSLAEGPKGRRLVKGIGTCPVRKCRGDSPSRPTAGTPGAEALNPLSQERGDFTK